MLHLSLTEKFTTEDEEMKNAKKSCSIPKLRRGATTMVVGENKDCTGAIGIYVRSVGINVGATKSRAETIAFIGNTDDNVTVFASERTASEKSAAGVAGQKQNASMRFLSSHARFIPRMYLSFGDVARSRNSSETMRYHSRALGNANNSENTEIFLSIERFSLSFSLSLALFPADHCNWLYQKSRGKMSG